MDITGFEEIIPDDITSSSNVASSTHSSPNRQISRFEIRTAETNHHNADRDSQYGASSLVGSHLSVSSGFSAEVVRRDDILSFIGDAGSTLGSSMLLASPSYLNIYHASLERVDDGGPKEENEDDIFDNPEYIDTLEGRLPLAEAARMIANDASTQKRLFTANHVTQVRRDSYKKVFCISISFFLIFSGHFSVRNLQSSTGSDSQLGLITYGALPSLMWLGGIAANPIIHHIRPKWTLFMATTAFFLYPCANFYPKIYTLLPTAMLAGFGFGLLWCCEGIYLMNVASTYALVSGEPLVSVLGRFNSIIFSGFLGSNILGNLLSSLIVGDLYTLPGETTHRIQRSAEAENSSHAAVLMINETIISQRSNISSVGNLSTTCGLDFFSNGKPSPTSIDQRKIWIYLGVVACMCLLASMNILFFLKKLKVARKPGGGSFFQSLKHFLRMFIKPRSLLIIPFLSYFGIAASVILADFNAAFIACQYGVGKIGFVVMVGDVWSVLGAILSGRLVNKTGRIPLVLVGVAANTSSLILLLLWKPEPGNLPPMVFVPACLWCLSHGILFTLMNGFLGELFRKDLVLALAMLSACHGTSIILGTYMIAFGLITLTMKIYIVIGILAVSLSCYVVLEYLLHRKKV